jgi:hypothetical protein
VDPMMIFFIEGIDPQHHEASFAFFRIVAQLH